MIADMSDVTRVSIVVVRCLVLGLSLALIACGAQSLRSFDSTKTVDCAAVGPEGLIQRYLLSYDGEEDKTYVETAFTGGHPLGPHVKIAVPCSLSDSASTLFERRSETGTPLYVARSAGAGPHTFTLVDASGNTLRNTVALGTIDIVSPASSISLGATKVDFEFAPAIDTSSWASGDVFIEFVDSKTNTHARLRIAARNSSNAGSSVKTISVSVKDSEFAALFASGQAVFVRLVREVTSDISGASATMGGGGSVRTSYATAYRSIDVTP